MRGSYAHASQCIPYLNASAVQDVQIICLRKVQVGAQTCTPRFMINYQRED